MPDQELIGLGAANVGAAFTGGYPVTGGFARSVVNFDAGAETPAAGAYTAVGLLLAALLLTPLIYHLPQATLAATIIVAVLSLVDFSILKKTWIYSRADFRRRQRHHSADARLRRRDRGHGGRGSVDPHSSLQVFASAHGHCRAGAGHRAFPQRQAP